MIIDDLFKQLKPILGHDIFPLQAIYIGGDEETKSHVERVLRVLYANIVSSISPPPKSCCHGKYPLGMVLFGNRVLYPFALRDEDFFHLGIFGQTGRGKTNAVLHLLSSLKEAHIPWLVFDWKRTGYRDLISVDDKVKVFTVGRAVSPFVFNPLLPPPGVDTILWYKQFIQCLSHAYFLGHGCEMILQDVLESDAPTLIEVLRRLAVYPAKWRKLQWLQSTERAVKALCYGGISTVLNVKKTPPITEWLDHNIVFELDALTESEAKFFINAVMSAIYLHRREQRHRGFRHVCVIEEAHHVLKREDKQVEAKSVMDRIFREIREYGESVLFIDQMPSTMLDAAFANAATQITFSLSHHRDVMAVGGSMLLDKTAQVFLGKLPVGTAIVKLQNRWHAPFFIRLPLVSILLGAITDEDITVRMSGKVSSPRGVFPDASSSFPRIQSSYPGSSVIFSRDKGEGKFLTSIHNEPLLSVTKRYKLVGFNPKKGNHIKKRLIQHDLIREVSISTRKGRLKLLELTDKGRETLAASDVVISGSLRHGGVEHLYWLEEVRQRLVETGYQVKVEHPIGNGRTVDLVVIKEDKQTAIEIETGKSDISRNIRKCLEANFEEILFLATNQVALKQIRSVLQTFRPSERRLVETYGVWNLPGIFQSTSECKQRGI